jgi:serine/threonine-protein kinase
MALHCTACGAENLETAQLCYSCGEPIEGSGPDALIGTIMFDSYKLVRVLGHGGMAVVYLGRNQLTEQEVAIKMLPPELAAYAEVKTRFLEEARTLAKLEHPNIVHLINFAEDSGRLCLVMQYAEGETFEALIDRVERVDPVEAVRIAMQTLDGLAHAHANNVVHRDIKPSNIIVRSDGSVKVTDFGIAKITRDNKLTQTGQTMGTVRYMAPEQVRGKDIDHRTDIYALGISCYEALTGEPPFDGESQFEVMQMHLATDPVPPREAGAPISEELERVLLKAMAKPQEDRYQTAKEFRAALAATPEGKKAARATRNLEAVAASGASSTVATPARRSTPCSAGGSPPGTGRKSPPPPKAWAP